MKKVFVLLAAALMCGSVIAQEQKAEEQEEGYKFTIVKELPVTSVKDQHRAGTCWCYSGLGFVEAELLRMKKGTYDFSEMYIVANTYNDRAMAAIRTSVSNIKPASLTPILSEDPAQKRIGKPRFSNNPTRASCKVLRRAI